MTKPTLFQLCLDFFLRRGRLEAASSGLRSVPSVGYRGQRMGSVPGRATTDARLEIPDSRFKTGQPIPTSRPKSDDGRDCGSGANDFNRTEATDLLKTKEGARDRTQYEPISERSHEEARVGPPESDNRRAIPTNDRQRDDGREWELGLEEADD